MLNNKNVDSLDIYSITSNKQQNLCNEFADYFLAQEGENKFYAIAFKSNFIIPVEVINIFQQSSGLATIKIYASGVSYLSFYDAERFVCIVGFYDLDFKVKIDNNLFKRIIYNISNLISFCDKKKISLGCINLENLVLNDSNQIVLRELFLFPNSFYQKSYALAPEIFNCLPIGRKHDTSADIYALGILIFEILSKYKPWDKLDETSYFRLRLLRGTANILFETQVFPENIKSMIFPLVMNDPKFRCNAKSLDQIYEGKVFKNIESSPKNSLQFKNIKYTDTLLLAYDIQYNINEAKNILSDPKFFLWLLQNVGMNNLPLELRDINTKNRILQVNNTLLSKILLSLQYQNNVIIFEDKSITFESLPYFLAYCINSQKEDIIFKALKIVFENEYSKMLAPKFGSVSKNFYSNFLGAKEKFKGETLGFGNYMVIYTLSSNLHCIDKDFYISSLKECLLAIEKMTEKKTLNQITKNDALISFLYKLLGIESTISVSEFNIKYPGINENNFMSFLILLSKSQGISFVAMKNFSKKVSQVILDYLDKRLRSNILRTKLFDQISKISNDGYLNHLVGILIKNDILKLDSMGYKKALVNLQNIANNINALSNNKVSLKFGEMIGDKICLLISYIIFMIVILINTTQGV